MSTIGTTGFINMPVFDRYTITMSLMSWANDMLVPRPDQHALVDMSSSNGVIVAGEMAKRHHPMTLVVPKGRRFKSGTATDALNSASRVIEMSFTSMDEKLGKYMEWCQELIMMPDLDQVILAQMIQQRGIDPELYQEVFDWNDIPAHMRYMGRDFRRFLKRQRHNASPKEV